MRVLICSRVRRALSSTSVDKAEVVRVDVALRATAHSVPTGINPRTMRDLDNGQKPVQQARMARSKWY